LEARDRYGQLDLIEQTVLKALLDSIPKGQVGLVWRSVRRQLRGFVAGERAALAWDPQTHTAEVTRSDSEQADAVRHGRPVYVLPLGELLKQARERWQTEVGAVQQERASRARSRSRTSPRGRSAEDAR
jgi:hypothetical protein